MTRIRNCHYLDSMEHPWHPALKIHRCRHEERKTRILESVFDKLQKPVNPDSDLCVVAALGCDRDACPAYEARPG